MRRGAEWKSKSTLQSFGKAQDTGEMRQLAYTLLFGFFAGILGMVLKKESLLYRTGFLEGYTLSPVKFLEPDTGELLGSVLLQRLGAAVLLIVLATTYLGCAAAYLYQAWSGLALGILAAGSMIRYGLRGFLLIIGTLFPQQAILIPAFLLLSAKCCALCRLLYRSNISVNFSGREKYRLLFKKGLSMAAVVFVVITGCLLESYVNPRILKFLLQFF